MKSYSETLWWSRWEIMDQLCQFCGDLGPFLNNKQDLSPKTMDYAGVIHEDTAAERSRNPQLELAAVIDVGQHFVKATYFLEGDGPLVFDPYKRLQELLTARNNDYQAHIRAMPTKLDDGNANLADKLQIWA